MSSHMVLIVLSGVLVGLAYRDYNGSQTQEWSNLQECCLGGTTCKSVAWAVQAVGDPHCIAQYKLGYAQQYYNRGVNR